MACGRAVGAQGAGTGCAYVRWGGECRGGGSRWCGLGWRDGCLDLPVGGLADWGGGFGKHATEGEGGLAAALFEGEVAGLGHGRGGGDCAGGLGDEGGRDDGEDGEGQHFGMLGMTEGWVSETAMMLVLVDLIFQMSVGAAIKMNVRKQSLTGMTECRNDCKI